MAEQIQQSKKKKLSYFRRKRLLKKNIIAYKKIYKFEKEFDKLYEEIYLFVLGKTKDKKLKKIGNKLRKNSMKLKSTKKKSPNIDYDYYFDLYLNFMENVRKLKGKNNEEDFEVLENIMYLKKSFLETETVFFKKILNYL